MHHDYRGRLLERYAGAAGLAHPISPHRLRHFLDHFEGRSWPGFHHHATLCFQAYGFLALERALGTPTPLNEIADEPTSPFHV